MSWGLLAAICMLSCAPAASFRPASALLDHRTAELGAGAVAVTPRPYVDEPTYATGQLWFTGQLAPWLNLSAISAFDSDAVAGGASAMVLPLRAPWIAAGAEAELGYAWAALAVPVSVRLVDEVWLYSSPRLGSWGDQLTPAVPVGLSVGLFDAISLRAEAQVAWADFAYFNRRFHLGAAAVYQFGDSSK